MRKKAGNESVKRTPYVEIAPMTPVELREIREAVGRTQEELSAELGYKLRAYQGYESRSRKFVPPNVAVTARLFQEKDRWIMAQIPASVERREDERRGL